MSDIPSLDPNRWIDHVPIVGDKEIRIRLKRPPSFCFKSIPNTNSTESEGQNIFQFTRDFAIKKLISDIIPELDVIANSSNINAAYGKTHTIDEIPHGLFNWSWDLFNKRREMQGGCIWLTFIEKEIPKAWLDILKLQLDLKHLKSYLEPLLECFLDSTDLRNDKKVIEEHVLKAIEETRDFLNVEESLKEDLKLSRTNKRELIAISRIPVLPCHDKNMTTLLDEYQKRIIDNEVKTPIKMRCAINHYQHVVAQWRDRSTIYQDHINEEIHETMSNIELENQCSESAKKQYNKQIEKYRYEINYYNTKYNMALEEIENKINYKNINIDKMRTQRLAMLKEIDRFHIAIDRVLKEEQELREAEERRLQEELEARLAEEAEAARLAAKAAKKAAKAAKAAAKKKK